MGVGQKIKAYLKDHGISQKYLARCTNIGITKLNVSLNGHRKLSFDEYELICGALNVGTDTFLTPRTPEA